MTEKEKNIDELNKSLYLGKLREKAFRKIEMYHPNLIANLSKEADELYRIRKRIAENILSFTENLDKNQKEVEEYLQQEINALKLSLEKAEDIEQQEYIKMSLEELEEYM